MSGSVSSNRAPPEFVFKRSVAISLLALGLLTFAGSCKTRTFSLDAGTKSASAGEEFPVPIRLDAKETYRLRRDLALVSGLTRGGSWKDVCVPRAELPLANLEPSSPPEDDDPDGLKEAMRTMAVKIQRIADKQGFTMEKSKREDLFPAVAFNEAQNAAKKSGEICFFSRALSAALLGFNKDAFKRNTEETTNFEVNFNIDTDGDARIGFYSLYLKTMEGDDTQFRKDSGINIGLLQKAQDLAKGMGAKSLTVFGNSVANPKIARVLTKRYEFALVQGDGKSGSDYGKKFDLSQESSGSSSPAKD